MADKPDFSAIDPQKCAEKEFPGGAAGARGELRVALGRRAYDEIRKHAAEENEREICGVMLGDLCKDRDGPYLHVTEIIRGEHAASQGAQVTITHETWNHFHREKDNRFPDKQYLGWYHSHPDFGIFLSSMDLFIHENFFSAPHQVALVVDALRDEEGLFYWKAGKAERAASFWVGREAHHYEPAPEPSPEAKRLVEVEKKLDRVRAQLQETDAFVREKPEGNFFQTVLLMGILFLLLFQVGTGLLFGRDKQIADNLNLLAQRSAADQIRAAMLDVKEDRENRCLYLEYRMFPDQLLVSEHVDGPTLMVIRKYRLDEQNLRRYLEFMLTSPKGAEPEGRGGAASGGAPKEPAKFSPDTGGSRP